MICVDPSTADVRLDRSASSNADFAEGFGGADIAPLRPTTAKQPIDIIVDGPVIEVFADGGATVLTALAFPTGAWHLASLAAVGDLECRLLP